MKKLFTFITIPLFFAFYSSAQITLELVKDIFPSTPSTTKSSLPRFFAEYKDNLYFTAMDSAHGTELWVSNGTEAGTKLVKDINPTGNQSSYPGDYVTFKDKLYFTAIDGQHERQLWVTDGTEQGTSLLTNNLIGDLRYFATEYKDKLFFSANETKAIQPYNQLWTSDGTTAGTKMFKDISPKSQSMPGEFTELNGLLYFAASDSNGRELWVTDGTEIGTKLFKDLRDYGGSYPLQLTKFDNKIYFNANSLLYVTDGTNQGTGEFGSMTRPTGFKEFKGKLYFVGDFTVDGRPSRVLWVTDGTKAGTQVVSTAVIPTQPLPHFSDDLVEYNGKLYFAGRGKDSKTHLWSTDGTAAETKLVVTTDTIEGSYPNGLFVFKDKLYFTAYKSYGFRELYVTDGTQSGTQLIAPPNATMDNPCNNTEVLFTFKGSLYFTASWTDAGYELWKLTDPTPGDEEDPSSIADVTTNTGFDIYPNPSGNWLTIQSKLKGSYSLYDLTGRLLNSFVVNKTKTISTSDLNAGLYLIKEDKSGIQIKFIKK